MVRQSGIAPRDDRMNFGGRLAQGLREPLVHFLLAGALIFTFYGAGSGNTDAGDRRIVIKQEQVERLAAMWSQTWQRPPSPRELDGLIRDYIKEEIYTREAIGLGLDKDDMVVRRRLRSKMEFLATSEAENMIASDGVLQAWLDKYPARYASDPVFSFDSVYLNTADGDAAALARAKTLLVRLRAGADGQKLGDAISLPRKMEAASQLDIGRQFGEGFAVALIDLPKAEWVGPVTSGFGLHLVRIRSVETSRKPRLPEVRQRVENDWRAATREQRENQAYQTLLDAYDIEIGRPE